MSVLDAAVVDRADADRGVAGAADDDVVSPYAGLFTRALAYVVDLTLVIVVYSFAAAFVTFAIVLVTSFEIELSAPARVGITVALFFWLVVYLWYALASFGKTIGMSFMGLRMVRGDGSPLGVWRSLTRAILTPTLLIVTLGWCVVGVLLGARNRALQDVIAGSIVVYDDARTDVQSLRITHARRRRSVVSPVTAEPGPGEAG